MGKSGGWFGGGEGETDVKHIMLMLIGCIAHIQSGGGEGAKQNNRMEGGSDNLRLGSPRI